LNGIAPAALTYLAALHFATSEYQSATRFCLAVLVDKTSQKDKETLNAGCLLFVDGIARIVGLCVLHKNITKNNLHCRRKRFYLDLRLSPEVFAFCLTVLSAEKICKHLDLHYELPESAFPMDEYVKALMKPIFIAAMSSGTQLNTTRRSIYRRTDSLKETKATAMNPLIVKQTVIDVLMEYSIEKNDIIL